MSDTPIEVPTSNDSSLTFDNPFDALAYLLFSVRWSLETQGERSLPRWVRIARARKYAKNGEAVSATNFLAHGSRVITNGLGEGASGMVKLVIFLREMLEQADSMVAIAEVGLQLVKTAASPAFTNAVKNIYNEAPDMDGNAPSGDNMNDWLPNFDGGAGGGNKVTETIEKVEGWLRYVPSPEDLDRIGQELYYLLCIVQKAHDEDSDAQTAGEIMKVSADHIDIGSRQTGKIRLMQWAFNEPTAVYGGEYESNIDLLEFGSRRIWKDADMANLPIASKASYENDTKTVEIFDFDTSDNQDLDETKTLLLALDYDKSQVIDVSDNKVSDPLTLTGEYNEHMRIALFEFQKVNGLDASGKLDNATINRLLNLDFDKKNVCKAKKRGEEAFREHDTVIPERDASGDIALVNPDAETINTTTRNLSGDPYKYYVVGNHAEQGWQQYPPKTVGTKTKFVEGFVGMASRKKNAQVTDAAGIFDGGPYSEGESSNGGYFFVARHTQPWEPGRSGKPAPSIYPTDDKNIQEHRGSNLSMEVISRMYQWVDVTDFVAKQFRANPDVATYDRTGVLKFKGKAKQRSLYKEREQSAATGHRPDQGRMGLEMYKVGSTFPSDTNPDSQDGNMIDGKKTLTEWKPTRALSTEALSAQKLHRKNLWLDTETAEITFSSAEFNADKKYYLLAFLDGAFRANYDIDAYFDEVGLKWSFEEV